jgi:glycosyltransferase involved in cell wall biosynthesis
MSREKVKGFLRGADFSVLYRPIERYAMAGFPTKFVESFSNGLPVLANLTSDLQWYLIDGFNGFISNGYSVESIEITIEKALKSRKEDRIKMKENAKNSAKQYFATNNFSSKFQSFFENLD